MNEPGKDPGYGQSILHDGMLIFRTPPYIIQEISLQDTLIRTNSNNHKNHGTKSSTVCGDNNGDNSPHIVGQSLLLDDDLQLISNNKKAANRRFSSTSIRLVVVIAEEITRHLVAK